MNRKLLTLLMLAAASPCVGQENGSPMLAKAKAAYFKESIDAIDQYLAREKEARSKVVKAYDQAITAAMKQGGEKGLDTATKLKAEKAEFVAKQGQLGSFKMEGVDVPDKRDIIKNLTGNRWTWQWNGGNDERVVFSPDGAMRLSQDSLPHPYMVTLMWVIAVGSDAAGKHSPFLLIMNNENTLHGFKVRDGRRVGAISK